MGVVSVLSSGIYILKKFLVPKGAFRNFLKAACIWEQDLRWANLG